MRELLDILKLFVEWKGQCKGKGGAVKFITYQTYADLRYMVFHVACHAALYLKHDKSIKMHQRRHGTDVCEHTFSDVRSSNPKPNMQQAREGLSHASSSGQMGAGRIFRVKDRGNSGTATRQADYDMVMEPMRKKRK